MNRKNQEPNCCTAKYIRDYTVPPVRSRDFSPRRRVIAVLLSVCLILPMLSACGGSGGSSKAVEGTISAETPRVGTETLALDMGEFPLGEEAACRIEPVKDPPALEGADIHAYSFEIDTQEELLSVMELTIPYDASALDGQSAQGNIAAAWYNEETAAWEPVPFTVNEDTQTLTLYTDHLSVYGCFEVTNPNTRQAYAAYAIPAFARIGIMASDPNAIVTTAALNGGKPGDDAIDAGLTLMDTVLNLSSAGVDTAAFLAQLGGSGGGAATSSLLSGIGARLGDLGLLCSIAQISYGMYNIYNGDSSAVFPCYANALKAGVGYTAGKLGARLYSLAFVGVLVIEYSINSFAQEALSGRKDIYKEAYSLYYASPGVKRSARDWAIILMKAKETAASPERYQLRIEGLVDRYAEEFWQDELVIAEYQSEAQKNGFTGGGGLNAQIEAEISQDFKVELYRGVLQDAFKLIAQKEALDAERAMLSELNAMMKELNKTCTLELFDSTDSDEHPVSEYAGFRVDITLPDTVTDKESWRVVLDETGGGKLQFTLLGYIMAGSPTQLEIYEKDATETAEPIKTLPFAMETETQRVDIGVEALPLSELVGYYEGTMTVTDVFVSDALIERAQNEPMEIDEDTLEVTGDCDATMLAAMKEAIGQSVPSAFTIEAEENETTACTISLLTEDTESHVVFSALYKNGQFTPESSQPVEGFDFTLDLYAQKTDTGGITLGGSFIGVPLEYPKDLKMTFTISATKVG